MVDFSRLGLAWIPVACVVSLVAGVVISYALAVVRGDASMVLPLISYIGYGPPEKYVFAILLYAGAYLGIATFYVRYKHLSAYFEFQKDRYKHTLRANVAGLVVGIGIMAGIIMSATFECNSTLPGVSLLHDIGGAAVGAFSVICMWLQAILSAYAGKRLPSSKGCPLRPLHGTKMVVTRFVLAVVSTLTFIVCFGVIVPSSLVFNGPDKLQWFPNDVGYREHVVGAVCEYLLAVLGLVSMLLFVPEFRSIRIVAIPLLFDWPTMAQDAGGVNDATGIKPPAPAGSNNPVEHTCGLTHCGGRWVAGRFSSRIDLTRAHPSARYVTR